MNEQQQAWPFDFRGRFVEGVKDFHDRAASQGFAVGAKADVGETAGKVYDAVTDKPAARPDIQRVLDLGQALLKGLGGAPMLGGRRFDPDSHRYGVRKTAEGYEFYSLADGTVACKVIGDLGTGKVHFHLDGDVNDLADILALFVGLAFAEG